MSLPTTLLLLGFIGLLAVLLWPSRAAAWLRPRAVVFETLAAGLVGATAIYVAHEANKIGQRQADLQAIETQLQERQILLQEQQFAPSFELEFDDSGSLFVSNLGFPVTVNMIRKADFLVDDPGNRFDENGVALPVVEAPVVPTFILFGGELTGKRQGLIARIDTYDTEGLDRYQSFLRFSNEYRCINCDHFIDRMTLVSVFYVDPVSRAERQLAWLVSKGDRGLPLNSITRTAPLHNLDLVNYLLKEHEEIATGLWPVQMPETLSEFEIAHAAALESHEAHRPYQAQDPGLDVIVPRLLRAWPPNESVISGLFTGA